jgi:hypothetical protein
MYTNNIANFQLRFIDLFANVSITNRIFTKTQSALNVQLVLLLTKDPE